ncbi:MAG TPA: RDD family protein, partial [Chthoniobacteraceae bacterium]|nr:RDD family protein [Chthoniobacteraceae bacterium]
TPMRPLHARVLIETLAAARLEAPEIVAGNLRAALAKPATVSLRRRLFTLTLGPLIALLLGLVLCGIVPVENRHFDTWWQEYKPGSPSLRRALEVKSESGLDSKTEDALDRYLAGHFGNLATDRAFWKRAEVQRAFWLQTGSQRDILRVANDRHPSVSPEELRNAEETLRPKFDEWARFDRFIGPIAGVGLFLGALAAGAVASMVWSIVAGMPLGLRLFGLALVNREGRQASRLRVLLRTFIAALPLVGITVPWFTFALTGHMAVAAAVALLVLPLVIAVSFIHALCQPTRSLADLIAGTTIVPR